MKDYRIIIWIIIQGSFRWECRFIKYRNRSSSNQTAGLRITEGLGDSSNMMHSHLTFYIFSFFPLFQEFELSRSLNAWFVVHFFHSNMMYSESLWYIFNSTIFNILRHSSTLFNYMSVDPSNWLSYCRRRRFTAQSQPTKDITKANSPTARLWLWFRLRAIPAMCRCGNGLVSGAKNIKFQGLSQFSISFPSFSHPFPRFVNEEQGFALWHPYIGSIYYSKYAANPQWDLAVA